MKIQNSRVRNTARKNVYYAIYDITESKTRTNVIQILKNNGLTRIQKSVFCGSLSLQQKKDVIELVKTAIEYGDSFYLVLSLNSVLERFG